MPCTSSTYAKALDSGDVIKKIGITPNRSARIPPVVDTVVELGLPVQIFHDIADCAILRLVGSQGQTSRREAHTFLAVDHPPFTS
nr:hypothetical protein CFP56_03867 [Quercus suber]